MENKHKYSIKFYFIDSDAIFVDIRVLDINYKKIH